MDYLVKQVCGQLGTRPNPKDVIYQGFLIIEHDEDLLRRYKALTIPQVNRRIAQAIKNQYGFASTKKSVRVEKGHIIKSFTKLKY
ncbi:MAG: hypothetical protein II502_00960 [Paludibacteraceae bacterium]|nr:hypothetical protein [Paludibacteraceae bacterium]